jgi:dihydroflavonol-4-reductase
VSSVAAIDASDTPRVFDEVAEFTLQDPSLHYAHAKHQAEMIAREAFARGVPVVVVNPAEVYGPGDASLGTAKHLIDFASSMPVLVCHGGTSVVHVDDVAAGILAALARGRAGERYILGGDNLTVRQLAEIVVELTGSRAPIVSVPNAIARFVSRLAIALHVPLPFDPHVVPYASRYWFVDSGKARRELGVTFRGALETIQPTLEWLEQAGHLPRRKRAAAVGPAWPP